MYEYNALSAIDVFGIIAKASNIRPGGNPTDYTLETFLTEYPQFAETDESGAPIIPDVVKQAWFNLAYNSLSYNRYHDLWRTCMGLFIAHWLTLYLQTKTEEGAPVRNIVNAGLAKGVQTSKSAGDLSVSYDFSAVANDFEGWGTYKLTLFGQQFITLARLACKGGMVVW
jgi:hypothetical protein